MSKRSVYHLVPDKKEGVWKGMKEGADRASVVSDNKRDAFDKLREIAQNSPLSQVKIHKKDGTIQEERTYGKDPKKYPG